MIRNVIRLTGGNMAVMAFGFVSGVLLARGLGPDGRGAWAATFLWPSVLGYVGTLGADVSLGRIAANRTWSLNQCLSTSLVAGGYSSLTIASLAAGAILLGLPVRPAYIEDAVLLSLLAVPALVLNAHLSGIALVTDHIKIFNTSRLVVAAGFVVFVAVAVVVQPSIYSVSLAYVASVWIGLGTTLVLLSSSVGGFARPLLGNSVQAIRAGFTYLPSHVLYVAAYHVGPLLLVLFSSARDLGLYVVAFAFASILTLISLSLKKAAFVAASEFVLKTSSSSQPLARRIRQSTVALLLTALCIAAMAPLAVPAIFGPSFTFAGYVAPLLALSLALSSIGHVAEEMLKGAGHGRPSTIVKTTAFIVLALSGATLASRWGAAGVATAYTAGGLVEAIGFLYFFRRKFPVTLADVLLPRPSDWKLKALTAPEELSEPSQ